MNRNYPVQITLKDKNVISVVGYQGSGKTIIGRKLAALCHTGHIETSDIVKKSLGGKSWVRSALPQTGERTKTEPDWLGKLVVRDMASSIAVRNRRVAVISGIREEEVHEYLRGACRELTVIELRADAPVRYERLKSGKKVKNATEFIEQDLRERALGVEEVLKNAPVCIDTLPEFTPDETARGIYAYLKARKVVV